MNPLPLLFVCLLASLATTEAALVKVVFGKANARASTQLADGSQLTTGSKSQSEVALDNGVVRAGSNTSLRMTSQDNIALEKGLALVAAKPRFFRRPINVQTSGHQLKVKGTAQIYHDPGHALRVVVIEGRMTVSLNSLSREHITLEAGQVLVINPSDTELPEPLEIDLDRLVSSAQLLAERFEPLPTDDLVVDATRRQTSERSAPTRDVVTSTQDIETNASGDSANDYRTEELIRAEVADDIDDLDNDGDPDDGLPDELDGEDDDLDGEDGPDGEDGEDGPDGDGNGDGDGGDGDGGDGGGDGDGGGGGDGGDGGE